MESLWKHEVAADALRVLVVSGRLKVVALFQRKELALAIVNEIPVILQLVLQLLHFFVL